MTGIETVVGGAAGVAAIKIGYDLFCKIIKAIAGKVNAKKLAKIQSEAYQEILKGDDVDMAKVEAILSQLSSKGDTSKDTARLKELHSTVVKSGRYFARPPTGKACKKPAAKKASAKKPVTRKVAAKASAVKKSSAPKKTTRRKA